MPAQSTVVYKYNVEEADLKYGVKVNLRSIEGDADLYVSRTCKVPNEEDYQWASSADGDDVIKIMPGSVFALDPAGFLTLNSPPQTLHSDPQFRVGTYYIGVYGFDRVDYRVLCTVLSRKSHSSHHSRVSKSTKQRLIARIAQVRDPESRENSELRVRVQEIKADRARGLAALEEENAEKQRKRMEEWRIHRAADADRHRLDFKDSSSGSAGTRGRAGVRTLHWVVAIAVASAASRWAKAAARARKLARGRRRFSSARYGQAGGKKRRISRSMTSIPIEKPAETLGRLRHTNTQRRMRHAERLSDLELEANLKAAVLERQNTERFKEAEMRRKAINRSKSQRAKGGMGFGFGDGTTSEAAAGVAATRRRASLAQHTAVREDEDEDEDDEQAAAAAAAGAADKRETAARSCTRASRALQKVMSLQLKVLLDLERESDPDLWSTLYLMDHDGGAFVVLSSKGPAREVEREDGTASVESPTAQLGDHSNEVAKCARSGTEIASFNTEDQLLETYLPIIVGRASHGVIKVVSSVNAKHAWQEGRLGAYIETFNATLKASCQTGQDQGVGHGHGGGAEVGQEEVSEEAGPGNAGRMPNPYELVQKIAVPDVNVEDPDGLLRGLGFFLEVMQGAVEECKEECREMVASREQLEEGAKASDGAKESGGGEEHKTRSTRWKPTREKKFQDLCKALERYETVKAISFKERMEIMKVRAEAEATARSKPRIKGQEPPPGGFVCRETTLALGAPTSRHLCSALLSNPLHLSTLPFSLSLSLFPTPSPPPSRRPPAAEPLESTHFHGYCGKGYLRERQKFKEMPMDRSQTSKQKELGLGGTSRPVHHILKSKVGWT